MERAEVSNYDLAKVTGATYQTICNYRSGASYPRFRTLYNIQQTLGCDMNALFAESE